MSFASMTMPCESATGDRPIAPKTNPPSKKPAPGPAREIAISFQTVVRRIEACRNVVPPIPCKTIHGA